MSEIKSALEIALEITARAFQAADTGGHIVLKFTDEDLAVLLEENTKTVLFVVCELPGIGFTIGREPVTQPIGGTVHELALK